MADDSRASDVGARYARALFDLCIETGVLDAVEADLKSLKTMIAESADLRVLLSSPRFSGEDKARGLDAIAARAGLAPTTGKFLGVLASNRRTGALAPIITAFERLVEGVGIAGQFEISRSRNFIDQSLRIIRMVVIHHTQVDVLHLIICRHRQDDQLDHRHDEDDTQDRLVAEDLPELFL